MQGVVVVEAVVEDVVPLGAVAGAVEEIESWALVVEEGIGLLLDEDPFAIIYLRPCHWERSWAITASFS